jgi:hypothetical protein
MPPEFYQLYAKFYGGDVEKVEESSAVAGTSPPQDGCLDSSETQQLKKAITDALASWPEVTELETNDDEVDEGRRFGGKLFQVWEPNWAVAPHHLGPIKTIWSSYGNDPIAQEIDGDVVIDQVV